MTINVEMLTEVLEEFPDGNPHDLTLLLLEIRTRTIQYREQEKKNSEAKDYNRAVVWSNKAAELESLMASFRAMYRVNRINLEEVMQHDSERRVD